MNCVAYVTIRNMKNFGWKYTICFARLIKLTVLYLLGNAPIILSQPHFYQGATEYIDAITGMNPSEEHATDIDIEPVSVTLILLH